MKIPVLVLLLASGVPVIAGGRAQAAQSAQSPATPNKDTSSQPKKLESVHARKLDGFDLSPRRASGGTQIGGASRGTGTATTLLAPHKGRAYTLNPLFQWSNPNSKIKSYNFTLLASDRTTLLCQREVAGDSFKYPRDAAPLLPGGDYFWTVTPSISLLGEAAEPAELVIVGGHERSELNSVLATTAEDSRDRAQIFVDKRLWYDAIETYTRLISAHPSEAQFLLDRAELYEQLPEAREAAQRDITKAETAAH